MFDIMIGISQQELTHDKGHTPRGSSVASPVSYSLSFPSQRPRYLSLVKHGIYLSVVGEIFIQDHIFTFLVFYYYITIIKRDMCHIHYEYNWSSNIF